VHKRHVRCQQFLCMRVNERIMKVALGLTRFRRGLQSSAGHTEDSGYLVNPSEKSIVANDETYALAA
jgi:hypothetical protein